VGSNKLYNRPSDAGDLMYSDTPKYDRLTKTLITVIPGVLAAAGIVVVFFTPEAGWPFFGDAALVGLIFYLIFPRRFQVFNGKLRIVLGWPLHWDIPLSTIKTARVAPVDSRWAYWGIKLATSSETIVEIVRTKGMNVILSPSNRETFLEQLKYAVKSLTDER
jgi:hypothetical protein